MATGVQALACALQAWLRVGLGSKTCRPCSGPEPSLEVWENFLFEVGKTGLGKTGRDMREARGGDTGTLQYIETSL